MTKASEELKDSIKNAIKDRLSDPLLGTIVLIFVMYNYDDFLLLAFDTPNISDRILNFKAGISNLYSIAYPVVIALLYVFAYPYIKQGIIWFVESRKQSIVRIIDKVKDESLSKYPEFSDYKRSREKREQELLSEMWHYKKIFLDDYKKQNKKYIGDIKIEISKVLYKPGTWVTHDHNRYLIEAKAPESYVIGVVLENFQSSGGNGTSILSFLIILTKGTIIDYNFTNINLLKGLNNVVLYLSESEQGELALENDLKRSNKMPLCTYDGQENKMHIHPGDE